MRHNKLKSKKKLQNVLLPVRCCAWITGTDIFEYPCDSYWPTISVTYALLLYGVFTYIVIISLPIAKEYHESRANTSGSFIHKLFSMIQIFHVYAILILGWMRVKVNY